MRRRERRGPVSGPSDYRYWIHSLHLSDAASSCCTTGLNGEAANPAVWKSQDLYMLNSATAYFFYFTMRTRSEKAAMRTVTGKKRYRSESSFIRSMNGKYRCQSMFYIGRSVAQFLAIRVQKLFGVLTRRYTWITPFLPSLGIWESPNYRLLWRGWHLRFGSINGAKL